MMHKSMSLKYDCLVICTIFPGQRLVKVRGGQPRNESASATDLIEKGFKFKTFLAMKFTTQHDLYQ